MADAAGGIDWEVHMVDGTSVRAHRCAAGGKGGGFARRWAAAAAASAASYVRGLVFSHEAVREWEAKLTPALAENLRRRRRGKAGRSWYMDETGSE